MGGYKHVATDMNPAYLEVSRCGTLDFGGAAAADHRGPADPQVRPEDRPCRRLYASGLLPGEFVMGATDHRPHQQRRGNDLRHQVLSVPGGGRRLPS
ncbi:hypothetical protein SBRY_10645 [Actinacidiphila bryophytorum]|uniref:Uncharacterized protein n=1 Tax=Actinacidiphila bryophytorum TaxID=1436133 RepID=A0A9W4E1Q9_9ACTN|nr:hypothetical protein SBRY_10645 [Actinacidiphila bryophytorum]